MGWPTQKVSDTLRLKDGEAVKVRLIEEEPETYYTHFHEGKTVFCKDGCELCIDKIKRDEKFSIKVVDISDYQEKKLNGSRALFFALKDAIDMLKLQKMSLATTDFVISRKGAKKDTRYTVLPMPGKPINIEGVEVPF